MFPVIEIDCFVRQKVVKLSYMVYKFLLLDGESDELLLAGDRLEVVLWLLLGLDKDVSEINVSEINNTYY